MPANGKKQVENDSDSTNLTNRRTFLATTGAVTLGATAGCMGGGSDVTTFEFLTEWSPPQQQDALERAFDAWADTIDEDVELQMEVVGFDEVSETFALYTGSEDAPDLVGAGDEHITPQREALQDVSDLVSDEINEDARLITGDKELGVPLSFDFTGFFYRRDIFEEAGIEWAETWDDHLSNLEALDEYLQGTNMDPTLLPANSASNYTMYAHDAQLIQNGAEFITRDSIDDPPRVILDEDPYRERAIEYLDYARERYSYSPDATGVGYDDSDALFFEEQVAIVPGAGGTIGDAEQLAPEFLEDDLLRYGEYPESPYLQEQDDPEYDYITSGSIDSFFIPSEDVGAENTDLARDFVEFYTSEDGYIDYLHSDAPHLIPVDTNLLNNEEFLDHELIQSPAGQDFMNVVQENIDDKIIYANRTTYRDGGNAPYFEWSALVRETEISLSMIAEVATGRTESDIAVDEAAEALRNEIDG